MIILHIIHLDLSGIFRPLLGQKIHSVTLLQQGVSFILFILKHTVHCSGVPLGTSIPIYHPFPLKDPLNIIRSLSIQKFLEQPDNDLCLSGIDDQFSCFIAVISQEPLGTHLMLSRFKSPADSPCGVFRNRPAFILC